MRKLIIFAAFTTLFSVLAMETAIANTEKGKCTIKEIADAPNIECLKCLRGESIKDS